MIRVMSGFLKNESGATTVDWVVLAASTVGIGLSVASSVSTGTNSLAGDINASFSRAEAAMVCQPSDPSYDLQILTGEREDSARREQDRMSQMEDDEVLAAYAETVEKTNVLNEGGEPDEYVNEVLDYAYLYAQELERRGLSTDERIQSFAALNTAITGATGSGGCGYGAGSSTDSGSQTESYDMQILNAEDVANIESELDRMDPREVAELIGKLEEEYASSSNNRDREGMQKAMDMLHLVHQDLETRGEDREATAAALEMLEKMQDDYQSTYG